MLVLAATLAALAAATVVANATAYGARAQALRALRPCDRPDGLGFPHTAAAFLQECAAWAAAIALLPFGWSRPESIAPSPDAAIVLIHDLGLNAGAFALLRHRLRHGGWRTVVTMRHPALLADTDLLTAQLQQIVESITATQPRRFSRGSRFRQSVAGLARCHHPVVSRS
jgi:hypothetical protein